MKDIIVSIINQERIVDIDTLILLLSEQNIQIQKRTYISSLLYELNQDGKIKKFKSGIYHACDFNDLDELINFTYVKRNDQVIGFYTGLALLNEYCDVEQISATKNIKSKVTPDNKVPFGYSIEFVKSDLLKIDMGTILLLELVHYGRTYKLSDNEILQGIKKYIAKNEYELKDYKGQLDTLKKLGMYYNELRKLNKFIKAGL